MTKKIRFVFFLAIITSLSSFAQTADTSRSASVTEQPHVSPLSISGYVDAYYSYYTDSVGHDASGKPNFQKFPTTSPRSNSLGLNMAMITAKYTTDKARVVIGIHYGDIVKSTWDKNAQLIQEAYAGIRLHKKVWLDAGFFRTHIGTEGLFAKENITSSVAVGTFNEPYYEAGARLTYAATDKLTLTFYLLNGYNVYEDNNNKKSFGMVASYAFNDNFNINYTNYIGDDSPTGDSVSHLRTYHNLYVNYQKKKFKMQVGGDFGTQKNSDTTGKKMAIMFSTLATFRYALTSKVGVYIRGEVFHDPTGFLGGRFTDDKGRQTGYKLWGATAGAEYKPSEGTYIRIEGRQLQCDDSQDIFRWNGKNTNVRQEVMIHMGYYF